jgi:hypothetical protein
MKMYEIPQIKLLSGKHEDTAKTGAGCFMNIVAYLNGEPQITDQSSCVCIVVRRFVIWFNDFCNDEERQELLPFILRAMRSATSDRKELTRRALLCVNYAKKMKASASDYAADATFATSYAACASDYASASARMAALAAAAAKYVDAAMYAARAGDSCAAAGACIAGGASRKLIFMASIELLNAMLPKAEPVDAVVIARANTLVELTA